MRPVKIIWSLLVAGICFLSCRGTATDNDQLTIATAANMQLAMQELVARFTENTGVRCQMIVGSSGKLTAQIKEGAPFDVFVAANMKYPLEIYNSGLAVAPPETYAYGRLVLWSVKDGILPSIDLLNDPSIRHIALANPKTAPYGVAAMEILEHYGLLPNVRDKLVYGESIAQVNQFIRSGSVETGFTAMSVVMSPRFKTQGHWTVLDHSIHQPIEQGIVMLKGENMDQGKARKFHDFLFSDQGKRILSNFGYLLDE